MEDLVRSTGAWDTYRDEIRAGRRKHYEPMDALFWAARWDSLGLDRLDDARAAETEGDAQGFLCCAAMWFAESATVLLDDHEKRKGAAA